MRAGILAVLGLALVGAACNLDQTNVTSPTGTGGVVVESFTGSLPVGSSRFFSFTVPKAGSASLTLLSLKEAGVDSQAAVNLGFGTPSGTGCIVTVAAASGSVSGTPVVTTDLDKGVYCAQIFDVGNLVADATFAVNIARPR